MVGLPEESDQAEQQRQAVEYVVSFVVFEILRKQFLIAHQQVVDKRDSGDPVAVFYFSAALDIVLSSGKVPHEVAPVHEVELVGEEEFDVFPLVWYVDHYHFTALVVGYVMPFDVYPLLVEGRVCRAVHTWEKHILSVFVFDTSRKFDV